jgi:hypothetical protein
MFNVYGQMQPYNVGRLGGNTYIHKGRITAACSEHIKGHQKKDPHDAHGRVFQHSGKRGFPSNTEMLRGTREISPDPPSSALGPDGD